MFHCADTAYRKPGITRDTTPGARESARDGGTDAKMPSGQSQRPLRLRRAGPDEAAAAAAAAAAGFPRFFPGRNPFAGDESNAGARAAIMGISGAL